MLPYGCKIEIAPNLYVGTVGADSISARGVWRMCKTARAHTVRPYTATKRLPLRGAGCAAAQTEGWLGAVRGFGTTPHRLAAELPSRGAFDCGRPKGPLV